MIATQRIAAKFVYETFLNNFLVVKWFNEFYLIKIKTKTTYIVSMETDEEKKNKYTDRIRVSASTVSDAKWPTTL